jgi:dihydropteroate synthase
LGKKKINGDLGGLPVGDDYSTLIMGVVNLSPTSFFQGSISNTQTEIKTKVLNFITEGADIIDVGAVSSAPSFIYEKSEMISRSAEIERLAVFFQAIADIDVKIPISIDTQSHKAAEFALKHGASIINDISGLKKDKMMAKVVSQYDASIIVMTCQKQPGDTYKLPGITKELQTSINSAVKAGIPHSKIIIDPGLGGWIPDRKPEHDYIIINQLDKLRILEQCILVGISRKSFIGAVLNKPPEDRLWGSLAATSVAIINGAHIVRTHDVQITKDACLVLDHLNSFKKKDV